MPDKPVHPVSKAQVQAHLHAISKLLRDPHRLGPEAQALLADLVDELSNALESADAPSPEVARLTETTSHLVLAVQEKHAAGVLAAARERLEHAVVAAETEAPVLAGLTRRLAEMLSNIGI